MAVKVLVVDDDFIAGMLSRDLLAEAGFDAELMTDSTKVMEKVKAERHGLVVLDILMPGIDGLTLCHMITSDPDLKDTKVVIISGKSFQADKDRARKYGALGFIEKPYPVETFVNMVQQVLAPKPAAKAGKAPEAEALSVPNSVMNLTIWGCRGAGPRTASRYGRKTSCVSLDLGEHLLIFDAGSGIADLGRKIEADKRPEAWLFMTHFHQDHQEGLPTFAPAARPGFKMHICGAHDPDSTLEQHVAGAFQSAPATISGVEAEVDLYEMQENGYDVLPGVRVTSLYANHPGATLAYIVEAKARKFVYCPDSEVYGEGATAMQDYDEKLAAAVKGADLLIHDARFTPDDYRTMRNQGHSSFASIVDLAGRSDVKRLLLFHHDGQYSDEMLDRIAAQAAQQAADKAYGVQVAMAREGVTIGV